MESKICTKCKVDKPLTEYCKSTRMSYGVQPACKSCMNVAYTVSRKKKQQHYQQIAKERSARNTQRIREWKSKQGCKTCDETFAQCLELHHLDPTTKEFDPSEGYSKSWESFLKEAAKCVVLCANCHRKVHCGVLEI